MLPPSINDIVKRLAAIARYVDHDTIDVGRGMKEVPKECIPLDNSHHKSNGDGAFANVRPDLVERKAARERIVSAFLKGRRIGGLYMLEKKLQVFYFRDNRDIVL